MPVNLTSLANVINKQFKLPLGDLTVSSNPFLKSIQKRTLATQELYLKGILSRDHDAGAVADGATVTVGDRKTNYVNPTLGWATYISKFSVTDRIMAAVADNTPGAGSLLMQEIQSSCVSLANAIAGDLFAGAVTNGLVGLQSMIADGNTYAGVDRTQSANANFRAAVVDATDAGTPGELSTLWLQRLDVKIFQSLGYGLSERAGSFTGITSAEFMSKYEALMESIDLGALSTAHFVNQMNSSGNLGYKSVGYKGNPLIRDRNMLEVAADDDGSGRLYFVDMGKIALFNLAPASNPEIKTLQDSMGVSAALPLDNLNVEVVFAGKTGEITNGWVRTYIQLAPIDGNPKVGGLLKNIDVSVTP